MTIRLVLLAAALALITGVGWKISNFFEKNFMSKTHHERVLAQTKITIEQTNKDATDAKKRIAEQAAKDADATPTNTDDDIDRLCQRSASCRDRQGR